MCWALLFSSFSSGSFFLRDEESRGRGGESRLKTVIQHTCTEKPIKQCPTAVLIAATVSQSAKRIPLPGDLGFGLQGSPVQSDKVVQVLPAWWGWQGPGHCVLDRGEWCCSSACLALIQVFPDILVLLLRRKKKNQNFTSHAFYLCQCGTELYSAWSPNTQAPIYVYNKPFNRSFSILTFSPHLRLSKQKFRCESPGPKLH